MFAPLRYPLNPLPRNEDMKPLHTIPGVINNPIFSYPITQEGRDKTICDSLGVCKTPIIRNPVHRRCAGKATH